MSGADWIIVAVIVLSTIQAASAGFFEEAFGIGGLVVGYLLAAWRYQKVAEHFAPYLSSIWLGQIAAFLIIFIGTMILAGIAGRIVRWMMRTVGLSGLDRALGAALGLVRGALIVAVVLTGMTAFTPTSKWLEGSQYAPYFLVVGRAAVWVAPAQLRSQFYQGLQLLRREEQPAATKSPSAP
ncbi:MAG: CvpA family protein [Acidobacteriota bacterium]|nr:CvpA family protein [Acidobacteriota bacterium]